MRVIVEIGKRYMHIETGPVVAEPLTVTEDESEEPSQYVVLPIGFQAPPDNDQGEPEW